MFLCFCFLWLKSGRRVRGKDNPWRSGHPSWESDVVSVRRSRSSLCLPDWVNTRTLSSLMNGPPVLFTAHSSEMAHISDFYFEKNVEKYSFAAENGCAVYLFIFCLISDWLLGFGLGFFFCFCSILKINKEAIVLFVPSIHPLHCSLEATCTQKCEPFLFHTRIEMLQPSQTCLFLSLSDKLWSEIPPEWMNCT